MELLKLFFRDSSRGFHLHVVDNETVLAIYIVCSVQYIYWTENGKSYNHQSFSNIDQQRSAFLSSLGELWHPSDANSARIFKIKLLYWKFIYMYTLYVLPIPYEKWKSRSLWEMKIWLFTKISYKLIISCSRNIKGKFWNSRKMVEIRKRGNTSSQIFCWLLIPPKRQVIRGSYPSSVPSPRFTAWLESAPVMLASFFWAKANKEKMSGCMVDIYITCSLPPPSRPCR